MKRRSKGERLYRCGDCQAESFHHWVERNRASRIRCPVCGSYRMDLASEKAREEVAEIQAIRLSGHRDMTYPSGSKPRRKVT